MKFYKDLKKQLSKKGINIINVDYYNHIEDWQKWYRGDVDYFHHYNVKLADGNTVAKERLTMNMPKKVCQDRTKLVWSETCEIKLDTDEKTDKLWAVLNSKQNNFNVMTPKMIELGFAQGTTAFVEFKDGQGNTIIEYVNNAMDIVPFAYDNTNITGMCILNRFVGEERNKTIYYTHITYHEHKDGNYTKLNELYKSKTPDELGKEIDFNSMFPEVEESVFYEDIERPHFQIFHPNIANNYDFDMPMGISVFANSIDRFKAIDIKYDGFTKEFIQGKKRICVDKTCLKGTPSYDEVTGTITQTVYFDKNDDTFVAVNGMENQPVKEIDMSLRVDEYLKGINGELNWLGADMGFGESQYSLEGTQLKTATQIMSEDSDAYRTKQADEIIVRDVLTNLVLSVCYLEGIDATADDVQIDFDYSRFKDETAEQQRYERELTLGVLSKIEYRMKVYGEDLETATAAIEEIRRTNPTISELVGE